MKQFYFKKYVYKQIYRKKTRKKYINRLIVFILNSRTAVDFSLLFYTFLQ